MIRRPPRSTQSRSSAASDVYKRQVASPDPEMFIMLGESETAGMCLKWFAEQFATSDEWARAEGEMEIFSVLDEEVEAVEPGSKRLIFTPWMYGERSPVTDTTLRASFVNLSLDHERGHVLRSIYEAVSYTHLRAH